MPGSAVRTREAKFREVKSTVIGRDIGNFAGGGVQSQTVTGWVTGGHSMLRLGIYVTFFPEVTPPAAAAYAGQTFSIYGWICDANGKRARASETAINNNGSIQLPDGWEGCSSLAEYEIQAAIAFTSLKGEWRLVVVIEPADAAACQFFDELAERVTVRLEGDVPQINPAS
ncbi:MAG: hypothetical protein ACJ79H_10030 [Myxococcales bacterium]